MSTTRKYTYIGPFYKKGLTIRTNGGVRTFKPRDWDDNKIEAMTKEVPKLKEYFIEAKKEVKK